MKDYPSLIIVWLLSAQFLAHAGAPPTLLSDSFRKIPGGVAWFDPADNTLNGAGISALYDRTGNGRNLLQATANNQPLISRSDNAGNLLVQSETFSTTWTITRLNAFGVTDTGAAGAGSFANTSRTLDPLGGNTADFIQENAEAGSTRYVSQTISIASDFWYSVYVKPAGRNYCILYNIGPNQGKYFDVSTGTILGTAGSAPADAQIEDAGNGWWRCSIRVNSGTTTTSAGIYISPDGVNAVYGGNNTSGLFLWGASLRPASWDSTYIATTATPAIAGLNGYKTAYFDGSSDSMETAAFNRPQPHTVVFLGFKPWTWTSGDDFIADAVLDGAVLQQVTATPQVAAYAGSISATISPSLGAFHFLTATFNGASSVLYLDNAAGSTVNPGTNAASGFCLGARGNGSSAYAHIQSGEVLLYNRALDAQEVAYLGRVSNRKYNLGF